eukprot:scaffold8535_cov49-Phaeocystis_antarctica.AAC.4
MKPKCESGSSSALMLSTSTCHSVSASRLVSGEGTGPDATLKRAWPLVRRGSTHSEGVLAGRVGVIWVERKEPIARRLVGLGRRGDRREGRRPTSFWPRTPPRRVCQEISREPIAAKAANPLQPHPQGSLPPRIRFGSFEVKLRQKLGIRRTRSAPRSAAGKCVMASLGNIWGALEIIRAEDSELEQTSLALSQPDQRVGREALHTERKRVSGNHFRVFRDGETGAITITDTSTWGTFVDEKKLIFREPIPLPHGAVITLAIAEADSAMFALRFHKRGGGPLKPFVFKPKLKTQSSSQWNPNETMSDGFATPGSTLDRQNGNSNRWAAASKKVAVGLDVQRRVA